MGMLLHLFTFDDHIINVYFNGLPFRSLNIPLPTFDKFLFHYYGQNALPYSILPLHQLQMELYFSNRTLLLGFFSTQQLFLPESTLHVQL